MRESAAKAILRGVRALGHQSVEIRENGKQFIFFCTVCLTPCYSDASLFDHLRGNLHSKRYASAEATLIGSNPWPFNDGVLFFHKVDDQEKQLRLKGSDEHKCNANNLQLLLSNHEDDVDSLQLSLRNSDQNLSLHCHNSSSKNGKSQLPLNAHHEKLKRGHEIAEDLVIPGVLHKEERSDLWAQHLGFGDISIRVTRTDTLTKIWCAWLGQGNPDDVYMDVAVPACDFGIVTFPYFDDLGREGIRTDLDPLSLSLLEADNDSDTRQKRKDPPVELNNFLTDSLLSNSGASFSEGHVVSDDSSIELPCFQSGTEGSIVVPSNGCQTRIQRVPFVSKKALRKDLRRRQRLASERLCGICQQKMLRGKDVATLLNRSTGNLACGSRNAYGAFHVFHVSCLIHWILLCESKIWCTLKPKSRDLEAVSEKQHKVDKGRARRKNGNSSSSPYSFSVFCPECQGTGVKVEDQLEVPKMPLSEMFVCMIKVIESHKAWMDHPEILGGRCSTGLDFRNCSTEDVQDMVLPLKSLHFYRAAD